MATYPNPRFIFSGELRSDSMALPRGVATRAFQILEAAGACLQVKDERVIGRSVELTFSGALTPPQERAVNAMVESESGVLVAPPGAGKTVVGCSMISRRKVSTLVLVHKQPLIDQWKSQISALLGIPEKEIGVLSGSKRKLKGQVDIAMIQTLVRIDDVESIFVSYGQIIVDECHHIPAVSFEAVMKRCQSKFVVGLTATPKRKDGLERLLFHQCGPVCHSIGISKDDALSKSVIIRETGYRLPEELGPKPPYHLVAELLATDESRNALIVADILAMAEAKQFTLVIADRKQQLDKLSSGVTSVGDETLKVFRFDGALSAKRRRDVLQAMGTARRAGATCVLFSTASLIGEGVDLPELTALVLASPVSFEGRLVQFAGRLHRLSEGKSEVTIIDYVDSNWAISISMYRNRLRAYANMGYSVAKPDSMHVAAPDLQASLFI